MENEKPEEQSKEEKPPEARCWIDKGILRVEVPLFMPNGEYVAYGMLHKAMGIVNGFFRHIEKESQKDDTLGRNILMPTGSLRKH